jgi:hypothetical protein
MDSEHNLLIKPLAVCDDRGTYTRLTYEFLGQKTMSFICIILEA